METLHDEDIYIIMRYMLRHFLKTKKTNVTIHIEYKNDLNFSQLISTYKTAKDGEKVKEIIRIYYIMKKNGEIDSIVPNVSVQSHIKNYNINKNDILYIFVIETKLHDIYGDEKCYVFINSEKEVVKKYNEKDYFYGDDE